MSIWDDTEHPDTAKVHSLKRSLDTMAAEVLDRNVRLAAKDAEIERLRRETDVLGDAIRRRDERIERLRAALRNVRGYIKDCDHEPAIDEIDAVLGSEQ